MITEIPDNIYKIFLALGIFLIGFSYLQMFKVQQESFAMQNRIDTTRDVVSIEKENLHLKMQELSALSLDESGKNNVKDPIIVTDDHVIFKRKYDTPKDGWVTSTIDKSQAWKEYNQTFIIYRQKLLSAKTSITRLKNSISENGAYNMMILIPMLTLGIIIFIIGGYGLFKVQKIQEDILRKELGSAFLYKECQSCAKKFNSTVQNATFLNGTTNSYYCTECFSNDQFSNPQLVLAKACENYYSSFGKKNRLSKILINKKFRNLNRWKYGEY